MYQLKQWRFLDKSLTMIEHQILYIAHNLCVAQVGVGGDRFQAFAMFLVDGGGLGMQNKGDSQETLEESEQFHQYTR
jgi:hypothetical protein